MNLKYYLRGLGIGITVTALIMGIASSGRKETLSDSEIKERAKALGMTEESTLLADAVSTGEPESALEPAAEKSVTPEETPAAEKTAAPEETPEAEETAAPEETPEAEETATPQKTPEPEETPSPIPDMTPEPEAETVEEAGKPITIQISSGDGSYTVCRKLEEAGLISSASEFDMYLYENGYDKRLNIGTFEIPEGAGQEQIARILAGLE